jgi:inner membrane protein
LKNTLLWKGTMVLVLAVLLWIPLLMIENTIQARTGYRQEAVQAIAASSAGEQKLWGPVLTVTVDESYDEVLTGWTKAGEVAGSKRQTRKHTLYIKPSVVKLQGKMDVEQRRLGLFSTPVFELNATLSGSYVAPTDKDLPKLGANAKLVWGAPVLTVGVGDTRGIAGAPIASLGNTPLEIVGGSDLADFNTGFHGIASATQLDGSAKTLPFSVSLRLTGTSAFGFCAGGQSVDGRADWQLATSKFWRGLFTAHP